MSYLALLSALPKLINRLLDKLDEFDRTRKQLQREERSASVQANPDEAFADLFGKSRNIKLHKPINREAHNVRSNSATTGVDNDS